MCAPRGPALRDRPRLLGRQCTRSEGDSARACPAATSAPPLRRHLAAARQPLSCAGIEDGHLFATAATRQLPNLQRQPYQQAVRPRHPSLWPDSRTLVPAFSSPDPTRRPPANRRGPRPRPSAPPRLHSTAIRRLPANATSLRRITCFHCVSVNLVVCATGGGTEIRRRQRQRQRRAPPGGDGRTRATRRPGGGRPSTAEAAPGSHHKFAKRFAAGILGPRAARACPGQSDT